MILYLQNLDGMNVRKIIEDKNKKILEYVNKLSFAEINKRLSGIIADHNNTDYIHKTLNNSGIVVINDFFSEQEIIYLKDYGSKLHDEILKKDWPELKTYAEKAGSMDGYAEIREGSDKGMIDAFHVDKILEIEKNVKEKLDSFIGRLFGRNIIIRYNAYFNEGIENTRGFHHDSLNHDYKLFVYLTDVQLGDGPYMYEVGSHRRNHKFNSLPWRLLRKYKTESPVVRLDNVIPLYSKAGTIILSNQRGNHRGYPQAVGGHRKLLSIRIE